MILAALSRYLLPAVAVAAFLAGAWVGVKLVKAGEVRALNGTIRAMTEAQAAREQDGAAVVGRYLLAVEDLRRENRVLSRRLQDAVPDNVQCDFNHNAVGVLNDARGYSLPETAAEPAATAGAAAGLAQRVAAVYWLADIADYNACRAQLNSLIEWHRRQD